MEFNENHKMYFSAKDGAFSKVTETEFSDSQVTLTGKEAEIVINYLGEENIVMGKVASNRERALKTFLLYPHLVPITLNLNFPKAHKKNELRLYLSSTKGFKPSAGEIWFTYISDDDKLTIGSCSEEVWNAIEHLPADKVLFNVDIADNIGAIKIFNLAVDDVIGSFVGLGQSHYRFALTKVLPLTNRFVAQRKILESKFYQRLERDILRGCLMPPITLAFVEKGLKFKDVEELNQYVNKHISHGYVLDGLQRLNTLDRASRKTGFDSEKDIFYNIIVAESTDKLLYRMITLNNGQKGMSPRHQIEILTQELVDVRKYQMQIQSEKEKSAEPIKDAFSFGDIARGYLAFLTSNVHNENSKIIDEKMDEILVGRILDEDQEKNKLQFTDVLKFLDKVNSSTVIRTWLQIANNFIGFCVGIKKSYDYILNEEMKEIEEAFLKFDSAFKIVNPSKVNVGKIRRELSNYFIANAEDLFLQDVEYISDKFFDLTVPE